MSEMRSNVDGQRSYYPAGGGLPTPSCHVVQLSLAEAIRKVASGEVEPRQIIRQLPDQLRTILDDYADKLYSKGLDALSPAQGRELFKVLGELIVKTSAPRPETSGGKAPVQPRSEMRMDSAQNYFPSTPQYSGPSRKEIWLIVAACAAIVFLLAFGAFAIWRWLM